MQSASGKDNSILYSFFAYDPKFTGGVRVAAGDIDSDGFTDLITAAGPGGGPQVTIFSGKDSSVLQSYFAYDPKFHGGVYVGAGDVNGDGKADVITGAGPGGGPQVTVFSGANGGQVESFFAYSP
jgi:serralysin